MVSKLYTITVYLINYEIYPFILGIYITDVSLQVSKKLHVRLYNTYCNSFSPTEEVWINETCLKAKIEASAWKTIRKTQYDSYEN